MSVNDFLEMAGVRVTARGYRRDSGSRIILDEDIADAVGVDSDGKYNPHRSNVLYLERSKRDGSITMNIAPRTLSGFGGEYRLYVHLTPDEIMRLFLECFTEVDDAIARLIERHKPANTSGVNKERAKTGPQEATQPA
jgi:hypothetical protein